MRSLRDLWQGLCRHPGRAALNAFVCFSGLWTITEALDYFFKDIKFQGPVALFILVGISLTYALRKAWKPTKVDIKVANSNTCLTILYGDLFVQDGLRAVAVSEFFDSQLGRPVSPNSLHGAFLKLCFGGHPQVFDAQVDAELAGTAYTTVTRPEGKSRRYPIGTTALITANSDKYIVFALTNVDPATSKASADVTMAWESLNALWKRARVDCGGAPINLPLVGSGLSGVGLPTRDLLNLIILSAITATKATHITSRIRIVLGHDRFEDLDLRDVKQHWQA